MLCMSIHGMSKFTEPIFYRGRHGQESEEGKEDCESSHQEGGKEDFKEKEVVASTTETLRLRVATRTHSKTFPKGLNVLCSRSVSRHRKTRPYLCADGDCIKVRFFVSAPMGMICCCADRSRTAETLRGSVHESPVRPLPDALTEKKTQGWRPWRFPRERLSARPKL
jgi:hypothetical protein